MTQAATHALAPKLRFPEFRDAGAWEEVFGNNLFEQVNDRNHEQNLPVLAITQENGAIPRDLINYHVAVTEKSIESYKVVQVSDFIISLRSFQGGIEYSQHHGICSPAYVILRRLIDGSDIYFKHYFKTERFIQLLTRNLEGLRDGKMISYRQFSELLLPVPKPSEQQKIADCLSSIDDLITLEARKIDTLKAHKKGLMQQLFPAEGKTLPKLRFPEFRDAGEWEEKLLSTLGQTISGLSGKSADDFGSGKPFVTYKQVFDNAWIDFDKCGRVKIEACERQNELQHGDILFTASSETPDEVGYASVILSLPPEPVYLNSFCFSFRPHCLQLFLPEFTRYLFHSPIYRKIITDLAQGSTRFNITKNSFLKLSLSIPPKKQEQQKIADCLSSIDELIALEARKIDALKTHKKGLMQQLFPSLGDVRK